MQSFLELARLILYPKRAFGALTLFAWSVLAIVYIWPDKAPLFSFHEHAKIFFILGGILFPLLWFFSIVPVAFSKWRRERHSKSVAQASRLPSIARKIGRVICHLKGEPAGFGSGHRPISKDRAVLELESLYEDLKSLGLCTLKIEPNATSKPELQRHAEFLNRIFPLMRDNHLKKAMIIAKKEVRPHPSPATDHPPQ